MHDDDALNEFRIDHGIPNNVQIERPRSNDNANTIEGNGNWIPIRIWLIHQARLQFPISPMLKEVMARCHLTFMQVSINLVWTILTVDTLIRH